MIEFFTLHFFTLLTFILMFFAIGHLFTQRKKPTSMIAWTITILLFPYVGVLFYIIFNGRKLAHIVKHLKEIKLQNIHELDRPLEVEVEKLLRTNGIAGATDANSFLLCRDGVDGYKRLMKLLDEAQESIYISTYIFGRDSVTEEILERLAKKAKEGLEVKLLIDAFGSFSLELYSAFLRPLKEVGGEYHFFMSLLKDPFNSKLNLRNHRKMIIVDCCYVMSGGINISEAYLSSKQHKGLWIDLSFILKGAAALQYREIFRYDWESDADTNLGHTIVRHAHLQQAKSIVQVVPSGPDVANDALYEAFLTSIYEAKERVWIVTPYFAPDSSLMDALVIAKHRGVDVKIVLPKKSDNFLVDIASSGFLRELQKEDIEVRYYKNKMMHAKVYLIDMEYAILGSSNFDARSFFYNFEVVSFFYTKEDILQVKEWIEALFYECETGLNKAGYLRIMIENFAKMFAPAL